MGDFTRARPLHEEALAGRRKLLGNDHLDTINSMHGLGQCLVGLGLAAAAAAGSGCSDRADCDQQRTGPSALSNLQAEFDESTTTASAICEQPLETAGLELLRQAVCTAQRVLGRAHPSTQQFLNGLASAEALVLDGASEKS